MLDIDPKIWGKHAWIFLDNIIDAYPSDPSSKDKVDYYNFFNSLKDILPCAICRKNYKDDLIKIPLEYYHLKNKKLLNKWYNNIKQISLSRKNIPNNNTQESPKNNNTLIIPKVNNQITNSIQNFSKPIINSNSTNNSTSNNNITGNNNITSNKNSTNNNSTSNKTSTDNKTKILVDKTSNKSSIEMLNSLNTNIRKENKKISLSDSIIESLQKSSKLYEEEKKKLNKQQQQQQQGYNRNVNKDAKERKNKISKGCKSCGNGW